MATTKTRLRKLERDRYERKLVKQAQHQRRRRRFRAGIGAFLTVSALGLGTAWLGGMFEPGPPDPEAQEFDRCFWQEQEVAQDGGPERVDVGLPDPRPPDEGESTITLDVDAGAAGSGVVEIVVDRSADPCAASAMAHLANAGFFDGTACHELTDTGALRCGDPSGTGFGGPTFTFFGENYPVPDFDLDPDPEDPADPADPDGDGAEEEPRYPAGTVALADVSGTHSSQFLLFFEDFAPEAPIWPILGTVTSGLDLLVEIGAAGVDGDEAPAPPAEEVRIVSLTVTAPDDGDAEPEDS